jgi:class 3 adenylate cyclase/streptogramin lyase
MFFLLVYCQKKSESELANTVAECTELQPPRITRIADLPDSLQPKSVLLSEFEATRIIPIPKSKGEYVYERTNIAGERQVIEVEPPQVYMFEVLKNEDGEVVKNTDGRPYVIGKGGKGQFTNFTSEDGLASDDIISMLIDRRGELWIGTYGGGVSRFDGKTFRNYTVEHGLPDNAISKIFEDSKGNLWFASNNLGVSKYDGKKFIKFRTYEGLPSDIVWSIDEDKKGNMWFGTFDAGVAKFDGKSFTNISSDDGLAGNFILGAENDDLGNMWFGGIEGLTKISGDSLSNYYKEDGLPSTAVLSILQKKDKSLWFGTVEGLAKFDGKSFQNYTVEDGLAENTVWNIAEDKKEHLWLATYFGLSHFDGTKITSYNKAVGLSENGTRDVEIGKEGTVWVGTEEAGLSRFDGEAFTNFNKDYGFKHTAVINDIYQDRDGNIWFASLMGLHRYDGYGFTMYSRNHGGLLENSVECSYQDIDGNLWFAGPKGITKFNGKSFEHFAAAQGLPDENVVDILQDKEGVFWLAFDTQIAKFDGKTFTYFTGEQGVPVDIKEIFIDSFGNFWITSFNGLTLFEDGTFVHYGPEQGILGVVTDIVQDRGGNMWLGTYYGIAFLDARQLAGLHTNSNKALNFKILDQDNGLIDRHAYQMLFLPDGKMAVGSPKGIQIFNVPDLGSEEFGKISSSEWYHISTGFPVKDINPMGKTTLFLDRDGIIWAGTESGNTGLVRFDYKAVNKNGTKPRLRLTDVRLNESAVSWQSILDYPLAIEPKDTANTVPAHVEEVLKYGKKLEDTARDSLSNYFEGVKMTGVTPFDLIPQDLVLPYRFNRVTFEFGTDELTNPDLIEYQYFLKGYDKDWSPMSKDSKVTFGNIREGDYTFQVRARFTGVSENGAAEWTEPVEFTFSVLPPWYRTWWAYLGYALVLFGVLRYYIKRRELALRKRQEELEETVSIRTAELRAEKKKSDDLLLNILPEEVAEELKAKGNADAQLIDEVTVLFTDFKGFTQLSERLTPKELVAEINECFSAFDLIMEKYGIEKIKTIGDAYMAAGGLPTPNQTHAIDVVRAAVDIQAFMKKHKQEREARGDLYFEIRIGIHTGPVVAGIVGIKKFQYDIWGDTVNTASRMESSGEIGKVNISGTTYELIKDRAECFYRGKISAKGKGDVDMYFVERLD